MSNSDVTRKICRWDIWTVFFSNNNEYVDSLCGKKRPALVISKDSSNNIVTVIPIRTVHSSCSIEKYIDTYNEIVIPISTQKNRRCVLNITQTRAVDTQNFREYFGTLNNDNLKHDIQRELYSLLIDDDFVMDSSNINTISNTTKVYNNNVKLESNTNEKTVIEPDYEHCIFNTVKKEPKLTINRRTSQNGILKIPDDFYFYYDLWKTKKKTLAQISKILNISDSTCYKWLKKFRSTNILDKDCMYIN